MTTTTKTADFVGRALVTPDTNARDYLLRPTGAGDRDFMGRLLTGGAEVDVNALLAEAAVRFDFSQYDDIADMVDVNGAWGPLDASGFDNVAAPEFTADGLRLTADIPGNQMDPELKINGVAGPLTIGPDGLSVLLVELMPNGRSEGDEMPFVIDLACDSANNFAPSLSFGWTLCPTPDDPDPEFSHDEYDLKVQEGDPSFANVVDQDAAPAASSPLTATGPIIMCAVCDVPNDEARARLISSDSSFGETAPFLVSPPSFVAAPMVVDYIHFGADIDTLELTYVELLVWNRALTTGEVDALVAHFTA